MALLRRSKTEKARAGSGADASTLGVLVVNDDEDACELLCRVVSQSGAVAFRAHSADGAIDELSEHLASVQGVVLDLSRGTAASIPVLETIRHRGDLGNPGVMIIATTEANRALAFESGVDEFLTRPFHVDEFTSTLGQMLARSPDERDAHRTEQAIGAGGRQDTDTGS
jgi:DNA-binding response OmpR family regulator